MKKTLLVIYFIGINLGLNAQNWNSTGDNSSTGNLFIGSTVANSYSKITIKGPNQPLYGGSKRDLSFEFSSAGSAILRAYRGGSWDTYLQFLTTPSSGGTALTRMHINGDGNVGIGTTTPDAKLTVKGNIHTNEVKVDLLGAVAPDYVFYKDYSLKPLKDVENYIAIEGHLPSVPSAKDMEANGIMLKEMNLKLLEKIEELTLYTINQEKRIETLESKNEKLSSLIEELLNKKIEE